MCAARGGLVVAAGKRPLCAMCGKPYGTRRLSTERITVEIGQPIPPSTRNIDPIKIDMMPPLPKEGADEYKGGGYVPMDDADRYPFSRKEYKGRKGRYVIRTFWDGTYNTPYDPFCTLRCALDFAQAAYRSGSRRI